MSVRYHKKFLKDLAGIPTKAREPIEKLVFDDYKSKEDVWQSKKMEKLKGYAFYYKIRVGSYRIGVKIDGDILSFERVLHRKEIYKFFP